MKKYPFKSGSLALKCSVAIFTIVLIIIIHSCRKDVKTSESASQRVLVKNGIDLAMLQKAYTKGTANTKLQVHDISQQVLINIINSLNVDWTTYSIFTYPDSTQVVEFSMPDDTTLMSPMAPSVGDSVKYLTKTAAVFILRKDTINMNFFMKTVEDATAAGSQSVLSYVHYQQIPTGFTGNVYYFNLNRQFINGWGWENGVISNTVMLTPDNTSSQTNNYQNKVKPDEISIDCATVTLNVYWTTIVNGKAGVVQDYGTISETSCTISGDGGGTGSSPSVGGVSGSGGSTGLQNPCSPASNPVATESVKGKVVDQVISTPTPIGGSGTGSSTGSTTPCPTTTTPTPTDPCSQAAALAANTAFKALMTNLQNNTTNNFEYGYTFSINADGTINATQFQGPANSSSVDIDVSSPIDGYAHDHYAGDDPTFSGNDILVIYQIMAAGKMKNASTFTASVVTAAGTSYIIKISNPTLFTTFGANNFSNESELNNFLNSYDQNVQKYNILGNSNVASYELSLMSILQGSGLTLFKGNSNFSSWTQIANSNNKEVTVNCN